MAFASTIPSTSETSTAASTLNDLTQTGTNRPTSDTSVQPNVDSEPVDKVVPARATISTVPPTSTLALAPPSDPTFFKRRQSFEPTFIPSNGPLFHNGVTVTDVVQGYHVGSCYLLGAMAALAHVNPDAIRTMVRGPDQDGIYTVTLHRKNALGQFSPREVRVKPTFPPEDAGADFTPKGDAELWPALIEKAYAVQFGDNSYMGIHAGAQSDSMERLTGKGWESLSLDRGSLPDVYSPENIDHVGQRLQDAYENRQPITVGNGKHVWAVVGVQARDGETYVTLYDPWGHRSTNNAPFKEYSIKELLYEMKSATLGHLQGPAPSKPVWGLERF